MHNSRQFYSHCSLQKWSTRVVQCISYVVIQNSSGNQSLLCCSVAQSCLIICNLIDYSSIPKDRLVITPGAWGTVGASAVTFVRSKKVEAYLSRLKNIVNFEALTRSMFLKLLLYDQKWFCKTTLLPDT